MSLTGYPSTRECPARYLMMPCQSLPDTRHRSRQIRRPAAQSKLRSSAQGCSACFVPRAHYEMQNNRDFTLTRWSLIRVCSLRRNTKKPQSKTPRLRDPNRIQTYNLLIRSQMLYSVELWDHTRYTTLLCFCWRVFFLNHHKLLLLDSGLLTRKISEIEDSCSANVTNLVDFN